MKFVSIALFCTIFPLITLSTPAMAGLSLCNDSDKEIMAAYETQGVIQFYSKTWTQTGWWTLKPGDCEYFAGNIDTPQAVVAIAIRKGNSGSLEDRWDFITASDIRVVEQPKRTVRLAVLSGYLNGERETCVDPKNGYRRTVKRDMADQCPNGWQKIPLTFWALNTAQTPVNYTVVVTNNSIRVGR